MQLTQTAIHVPRSLPLAPLREAVETGVKDAPACGPGVQQREGFGEHEHELVLQGRTVIVQCDASQWRGR